MTAMTTYGTFDTISEQGRTVYDHATAAIRDHLDDFDVPALIDDYRHQVNAALPRDWTLAGESFIIPVSGGPAHGGEAIRSAIATADDWLAAHLADYDRSQG